MENRLVFALNVGDLFKNLIAFALSAARQLRDTIQWQSFFAITGVYEAHSIDLDLQPNVGLICMLHLIS